MTSRRGAGAPLPERGGPGPRAASIAPPIHAPVMGEYPVLRAIRSNRLLDLIRHSDSPLQIRRTARLVGDLAAITSTLTMTFANLLFHSMSGDSPQRLQQHFLYLCRRSTLSIICALNHWSCVTGISQRSIVTSPFGYWALSPASGARRPALQNRTTSPKSSQPQRCHTTRHLSSIRSSF